jgi:prepilin-type processing-associated H-X9-DG protein
MEEALKVTRTCTLAVWSLVLGILSFMCFGMFSGIPAVICGHLAQSRIRHSGGALGGGGLAIGGLVTGYVGTVLTSIAVLGVLAGMLLPAVATARDRARRVQCMSNLSQIGKCCFMYAMEHDERFPSDFKDIAEEAGNIPQLFVCPATGKQPGDFSSVDEWSDYTLVPNRSQSDPSSAVLAFSKPECYPGKGGNILMVDGAVQWSEFEKYNELTAEFRR